MRIILTADDFGYCNDTVDATIACFERGALTSASIMPRMPATDRAVDFARQHQRFSFGLHLTLISDGQERPVSDPKTIPCLLDATGRFLPSNRVRLLALLGRISAQQLEMEIEAQIAWLSHTGVCVSHVDSHGHLHKFKPIRAALGRVLARTSIRHVRNVQNVYLRRPALSPTRWLGPRWSRAITTQFESTMHFYMPTTAHDANWPEQLLGRVSGATLEVGVHPGSAESWRRREAQQICEFAGIAKCTGHELIGWREL